MPIAASFFSSLALSLFSSRCVYSIMKPPQTQQQPPQTSHPETLHHSKAHHLPSTSHPLDHRKLSAHSPSPATSSSTSCPSVTLMNFSLDNSHTQSVTSQDNNNPVEKGIAIEDHLSNGSCNFITSATPGDHNPIHHLMHPLQFPESPSARAPPPMTHPSTPHHQQRGAESFATSSADHNGNRLGHPSSILYPAAQESSGGHFDSAASRISPATCKLAEPLSAVRSLVPSSPASGPMPTETESKATARTEDADEEKHLSSVDSSDEAMKEESPELTTLAASTPVTSSASGPLTCPKGQSSCFGCGNHITDRYYLLALDQKWHTCCLKCCICKVSLDSEVSCFTRDSRIYCKEDYYKIFAVKRCTRCGQGINASDLVMKIRGGRAYHISCFTCAWCNSTLSPGDYFGLSGNLVYCRSHLSLCNNATNNSSINGINTITSIANNSNSSNNSSSTHQHTMASLTNGTVSNDLITAAAVASASPGASEMVPSPSAHNSNGSSPSTLHYHSTSNLPIHNVINDQSRFSSNPFVPHLFQGHTVNHHQHHHSHNLNHVISGHQQQGSQLHSPSGLLHGHGHHSTAGLNHPQQPPPPPPSQFIPNANVHPGGHLTGHVSHHLRDISTGDGVSGGNVIGIPRSPPIPSAMASSLMSSSSPPIALASSSTVTGSVGNGICSLNSSPVATSASSAATVTVSAPTATGTGTTTSTTRKGRPRKKKQLAGAPSTGGPGVLSGHQMLLQGGNSTGHLLGHPEGTIFPGDSMNGLDITPSTTSASTSNNVTVISSSISSPSSNSCHVLANSSVHNNSNNSNSSGSSNGQQSIMSTSNLNAGTGGRTKRMRTSFKHHQLRTMKQYFSLNQNPDAKDLKALAQKTNLSKRVLQVWFQNARAKWRRNNLKMAECSQIQNADPNSQQGATSLTSISSCTMDGASVPVGVDVESPLALQMSDVHASLHSSMPGSTQVTIHDPSSGGQSLMVDLYPDKVSESSNAPGHPMTSLYSNSTDSTSGHLVNSTCCF